MVERRMSVRETERMVHELMQPPKAATQPRAADPDTARLETELAERLGAKVRIDAGRKGQGRLVISYASLEQLDGILARLR